ncbi:MAG: hypothetical protein EPN47_13940 [Acidobacteria bacterium]|nr:MAG: hypothetical protein EPN47_13940 [Acidobacteriota bacterium]
MSAPLESYLRTYRKRSGLSQEEVAFLIGAANGVNVARHEQLDRQPDLPTALAYEIIFRAPVRELFAGLYQKVEAEAIARARSLADGLSSSGASPLTLRKILALQSLSAPATAGSLPS